jgi:methylenetetrahydrofolate--tRNA-(uracil-5-)-methyltransferase
MGMLAGIHVARVVQGLEAIAPPRETALGSLVHYIAHAEAKNFQPANITFDLLPQLDVAARRKIHDKKLRHQMVCSNALGALARWQEEVLAGAAVAAGKGG